MPRGRPKKASTAVTPRRESARQKKVLSEVQDTVSKSPIAKKKASVAVKRGSTRGSQTPSKSSRPTRKASQSVRYSQPEEEDDEDDEMGIFDDSDSEDDLSSSEESMVDENNNSDPSQIYETIEKLPRQKPASRPQTSSNIPATPGRGKNALLSKFYFYHSIKILNNFKN